MSDLNRRDLLVSLAALTAMSSVSVINVEAVAQAPAEEPRLAHSQIFAFQQLPLHTAANGTITRPVLRGTLATGEYVEVHETQLPAGEMPHPPHRHTHSEFLLIREGVLEVESDAQKSLVHAGDVVFTASAVLHGLKNIGQSPANYFVVAVGVQETVQ